MTDKAFISNVGRTIPLVVLAAVALAVSPGAARAVSAPAVYMDAAGDSTSAPDVQKVTLTDNGNGTVAVAIDLAATIPDDGSLVSFLIDADRSPKTGDDHGFDYVVVADANSIGLAKWDSASASLQPFAHALLAPDLDGGRLTFTLTLADIGSPAAFDLAVIAFGAGDTGSDVAPDSGKFTYPQPTVQPTQPVAPPAKRVATPTIRQIVVNGTVLLPKAGKAYPVGRVRVRLADDTIVPADSVSCTLSLKGVQLRPTGHCTWQIPKNARKKHLTLKLVAGYQGATGSVTLPVTPS